MPLKTAKSKQPIKEFLPAAFKLQLEKEEKEREQRRKLSDGPGRYLRAPQETTDEKSGKLEPGSVEFRVLSEACFGWTLWYETAEGGRACKRWLAEELLEMGIEGGNVPPSMLPDKYEKYAKSGNPKISKCLSMVVYNITESSKTETDVFQIWDLDKVTLTEQFSAACYSSNYGYPTAYDFVWTRVGQGTSTKHTLQPQPPYELPEEILDAYLALGVNLKAHAAGRPLDEVWSDIQKREDTDAEVPF